MIRTRPVVSSCEPLFEKRRRFCAFDSASNRIHHATTHRSVTLVETKPIRQMQLAAHGSDFKTSVANLEKPLLENDAQDFVAQQFGDRKSTRLNSVTDVSRMPSSA